MPPKKIESNSCGYVCSVSVAIGDGIVSVGADIAYGIERSFEGLGGKGQRRVLQIGFENGNIIPTSKPNEILILGGKLN